ncbi:inositol phosphorylceramide synthase [Nocardia yunnanensis]|uniref:Inositol phosphorylceramide synthase n=1 Tax=Nocardia yunnanensis TaxID=2382165 RepID=A0A386ZI98_9NOCA|nr:phosphatase PAP2 family protein [Nocardia yunnanensis]AYF77251.1 inositol phosphorylceramide synthase [Nocardia yunnanensis]
MLLDDPRSRYGGAERRPGTWTPSPRARLIAVLAVGAAALLALQFVAARHHFTGPLESIWDDFTGNAKSFTVPWAGLGLALIGLSWRRRGLAVAAAFGIDLVYQGIRTLSGGPLAMGNGPVLVLLAILGLAWFRWQGAERGNALHAGALGMLLVLSSKVADVWLGITVLAGPRVLDEHIVLVDHALGDPSWMLGQLLAWLGPVASAVLHWVYIELPLGAMIVTVWQLRDVVRTGAWPRHYLVRTFLVLGLIGPIFYIVFPVVGPMFAFGADGHAFSLGAYWPNVVPPVDLSPGSIAFDHYTPRNCMPSLHTAWALSIFIHSRRDPFTGAPAPVWLRWGGAFWLVATLAATLGFGYHYGADLVAGAVLCLTVESALRAPERGWDRTRLRLVGAGAALFAGLLLSYRYLSVWFAEHPMPAGMIVLGLLAAYVTAFYRTWFAQLPIQAPALETAARA